MNPPKTATQQGSSPDRLQAPGHAPEAPAGASGAPPSGPPGGHLGAAGNASPDATAPPQPETATPIAPAQTPGPSSDAARVLGDWRLRLRDYLRLRPYGRSLLSPSAAAWIGSAWMVILLMASLEGFVWGAVGFSLVPAATAWLAPPVAVFLFLLMFSVIWIVDASLIMSEKPHLRFFGSSAGKTGGRSGSAPLWRWLLGLLVRIAIVAISLYVTAPFVEKLIRADDINAWHQAQVEQYFAERAARLQQQVEARVEQLDDGYRGRIASLEQQITRLDEAVKTERALRADILNEYQPETEVLTEALAQARERMGDEVLGRDGRPQGYGPEARKWEAEANRLNGKLETLREEQAARLAPVETRIAELEQQLAARAERIAAVRAEEQALLERIRAEIAAEQPAAEPPKLTFAARSKGLTALRESPSEQGVPHFETVEGFAQAALGILFFALIALKLFEPPAVQAYYSETIQTQYRNYLAGGLAEVPGFDGFADPARCLSPTDFARRWEQWERAPERFIEAHQQELDAKARLERLTLDREHERELLRRRRDGIDHQLALEHQRREAELLAREREIELRLGQLSEQLEHEGALRRRRSEWALQEELATQAKTKAEAEQAAREQRLSQHHARLEQYRTERQAHREQQLALAKTLADNRQAISATEQQVQSLQARVRAQQPSLEQARTELEAAEQRRAEAGILTRLGALSSETKRLRAAIKQREKQLAPDLRALDEQRGQLMVLKTEHDQLKRTLLDHRAAEDELQRRCDMEREAIDQLLLHGQAPIE